MQASRQLLPEAPQLRLGWVLAAGVITIAIAVFAMSTGGPGPQPNPPWAGERPTAKSETPTGFNGNGNPHPAPPPADGPVGNIDELAAKLADPNTTHVKLAPGLFDLTKLPEPVVFRGKELELVGSLSPPTVIRVNPGDCRAVSAAARTTGPARERCRSARRSRSPSPVCASRWRNPRPRNCGRSPPG